MHPLHKGLEYYQEGAFWLSSVWCTTTRGDREILGSQLPLVPTTSNHYFCAAMLFLQAALDITANK